MRVRYLTACVIATTMGATPVAWSGPGGGAQVTQLHSTNDFVTGQACTANFTVCVNFSATAYTDLHGAAGGVVSLFWTDFIANENHSIDCEGPEYANVVSVNAGNGKATVSATLNPSALSCYVDTVNAPVTVSLSGVANGDYYNSENRVGRVVTGGEVFTYTQISDLFSETFTGTVGVFTGTTNLGYASTTRDINRQRVK